MIHACDIYTYVHLYEQLYNYVSIYNIYVAHTGIRMYNLKLYVYIYIYHNFKLLYHM
jgi:hypothetical protein